MILEAAVLSRAWMAATQPRPFLTPIEVPRTGKHVFFTYMYTTSAATATQFRNAVTRYNRALRPGRRLAGSLDMRFELAVPVARTTVQDMQHASIHARPG